MIAVLNMVNVLYSSPTDVFPKYVIFSNDPNYEKTFETFQQYSTIKCTYFFGRFQIFATKYVICFSKLCIYRTEKKKQLSRYSKITETIYRSSIALIVVYFIVLWQCRPPVVEGLDFQYTIIC